MIKAIAMESISAGEMVEFDPATGHVRKISGVDLEFACIYDMGGTCEYDGGTDGIEHCCLKEIPKECLATKRTRRG